MIGDRRKPGGQEEAPRGADMKKELTTLVDFASRFIEAGWVEMPGALMKRLTAAGAEEEAYEAGWKAYDAWVRLANEAVNRPDADRTCGRRAACGSRVKYSARGTTLAIAFLFS